MCTYTTTSLSVFGNAKAGPEWDKVKDVTVYLDHPVAFPATHSLNIDFFSGTTENPTRRVALELDPMSAKKLAEAILGVVETAPESLLEEAVG